MNKQKGFIPIVVAGAIGILMLLGIGIASQNNNVGGTINSLPISTFLGLTDTPNTYSAQGGKVVAVKSDASGLEFTTAPSSMVYPGAGIALSTGSAWDTSIINNSANWNTAYGWGNHASAGYVTGTPWTGLGYITRSGVSAGTGISYDNSTGVITNSAPDQTVALSNGTGITTSGTYPNFTITNSAPFTDAPSDGSTYGRLNGAWSAVVSGAGDMILNAIQSVTGLKTFDKDKLAMKGTSTGVNTISVANTSATSYTNTIPAKDGTFAMTSDLHSAVTLGTPANGLGLSTQELSIGLASTSTTGALSSTDWNTFNGKQAQLNGTGFVKASGTSITYDNSTYLTSLSGALLATGATTGATSQSQTFTNGVTLSNLTASKVVFTDADKKLTSTGIGTSAQFIKGDGSLDSNTYGVGTWTDSSTNTGTNKTLNSNTNYIDGDALHLKVLFNLGSSATVGMPVYSTTWNIANTAVEVSKADADSASTMPCIGLVETAGADGSVGSVRVSGVLSNVDTSSWSEGTALYVSGTAGTLTSTKPTGATQLAQRVGTVIYQHATAGQILVQGAGRSNDVPNTISIAGSLTALSLLASANDSGAIGASGTAFSDLFLANGAVINFNAGDVTLTHSADTLTLGGGNLALGSNSLTLTGSIGATGSRVTKGWFTDIESTNMPTVGGTSLSSTFASISGNTAQTFGASTLELGHASDTTLARVSAGVASIEGKNIYLAGGTDVAVADGGTGLSSFTAHNVLTGGSAGTALGSVAPGTSGNVLTSDGTDWTSATPVASSDQYGAGTLSPTLDKIYFTAHLPFIMWTGAVANDTTTTFVNWVRTDGTKVVVSSAGNMTSFESTGSAQLYVGSPLYSSGSTALDFADNNIIIYDFWAKYISGAGENMMGIGVSNNFLFTVADQPKGAYFSFVNGVIKTVTGAGGASPQSTDVSTGITETDWNNYRIVFDMGADEVKFYINGTLVKTSTGATIPTSGTIQLGFGRHQTNPVLFNATAPNLSLEMNP